MAKSPNQKMKVLYILDYLMRNSDEQHPVPAKELIKYLEACSINAERKSIYSDIEGLQLFGVDIIASPRGYFVASRDFELPELKMLVDCVLAANFITKKKSDKLIKKIEALASKHQANKLHRQLFAAEGMKNANEEIYISVDTLAEAINDRRKIAFKYFEYGTDKKRKLRNGGNEYVVSPYSLTVSDENYYLISHYPKHGELTHFRVDRMLDIRVTDEECESVEKIMGEGFNIGDYSKRVFSMYSGDATRVEIICENALMNAVVDRFGENVFVGKVDDGHFKVAAKVNISPTFFAWVFTFGGRMKIVAPYEVKEEFNNMIKRFEE